MEKICTVYKTTDYSSFKTLNGNRSLNMHNLNRIKDSMTSSHLISPITVNGDMEIIDGQHRFEAQRQLLLPVYYMKIKGYGLEEVHILNSNSSNWGKKEYLNSYCNLGRKEYLRLKKFMELYPDFTLQNSIALLSDYNTSHSGKNTVISLKGGIKTSSKIKTFENGEFQIVDWDFAVSSAEKLLML